jgi:hypothetical protein
MTRSEHVAWCKERALEYIEDGDLPNAVASMLSDLEKHPETENLPRALGPIGLLMAMNQDKAGVRRWIEGFN